MILVRKGAAPARLLAQGAARTRVLCRAFDTNPQNYSSNRTSFKFLASVYGHSDVRSSLESAQHGKCCYCEVKIPKPYAPMHVEHYRPKGYSQQSSKAVKNYPGYYWLAYDWDNLFLSCQFCNSSNKRNFFPLSQTARRAVSHHGDIFRESPLILNPSGPDDPRDHIKFHQEIPKGRTRRGKTTIAVIGLDRQDHELRLQAYTDLKDIRLQIQRWSGKRALAAKDIVRRASAVLENAVRPSSPWSAMAQDFLAKNPIP
jgi:uncharacterized protein (TIGR02646 family)